MGSENIIKILTLCAISALIAVLWTPLLTNFLYKHKLWRKSARDKAIDGGPATVFHRLHKDKEVNTPRMGGLLIWLTTIFLAFLFAWLNRAFPQVYWLEKMNFLSRSQTWLPLGILLAGSLLGLGDDILQIFSRGKYAAGGIRFTRRFLVVLVIALIGAYWFYFR